MSGKNLYPGIFVISAAALALEISLIRFFSISQWYHFAFMVVSIALFGIAASGTFLAIRKVKNPLFISSIAFSLSVLLGFFVTNSIGFDPYRAVASISHVSLLLLYYIFLGLPFFFFGIIVAHAFTTMQKHAGKVYFWNMSGSALGTAAALFFIAAFHVKTVLIISTLGLVAALLFAGSSAPGAASRDGRKTLVIVLLVLNLLLIFLPFGLQISPYKELSYALSVPGSQHISTRHNAFSQVDVVQSSFTRYAPGLSPTFSGTLPEQTGITVDAANMNSITKHENLDFIENLPSTIAHKMTGGRNALVINAGAGLDVLAALQHNATVTAVEANSIVIRLLQDEYAAYSGNIYNRADVVWDEGRSFLRGNDEKFDIIVVSLAGNVLSGGAGISSLSENYLLTREAFEEYHAALSDDGVLVVTRWLNFPPRESLRLFALALEIDEEAKSIAMLRSWSTVTLLLSKQELSQRAIGKIKGFAESNRLDIIHLPGEFIPNQHLRFEEPYYYNAVQNLLRDRKQFYRDYVFDVSPVTDDRPFYFNFFKLSKINELRALSSQQWNPFLDSGFLLLLILAQAVLLALIFILLPLAWVRKRRSQKQMSRKGLAYFFAIGLAYLFIEIVLIQKFVLFLGHIVFASSTILFSMLLFSSIGALYSHRLKTQRLRRVIMLIFIAVIAYVLLLDTAFSIFIAWPLAVKMLVSVIVTAPLGFVMGMPFPLGIRAIEKELIAWSWAANGSASVLSPVIAVLLALFVGYSVVLLLAAGLYIVGSLFIASTLHQG